VCDVRPGNQRPNMRGTRGPQGVLVVRANGVAPLQTAHYPRLDLTELLRDPGEVFVREMEGTDLRGQR
jgi:hypothetical protein